MISKRRFIIIFLHYLVPVALAGLLLHKWLIDILFFSLLLSTVYSYGRTKGYGIGYMDAAKSSDEYYRSLNTVKQSIEAMAHEARQRRDAIRNMSPRKEQPK